ncbi:LysR family transcriptional regulator [Antarctobacter jejuensis]|uniref:LysR family transcriptional regulator n=1 Tax=Antarctobacter jejuensis TaxID=1439938 RepID=UPI003FD01309
MRHVNLNALRVFATVAKHGNLQRAAETLNLSRGAVSQRIKQLELDLGTPLMVRQARGVSLTPAGERCRDAMNEALAIIDTALADVVGQDGQITLHLGPSFATKWLMPRMERFRSAFPGILLTTEIHDQIMDRALGRGEIAIWPGTAPDPNPAHHSRHLTELRLAAVCSPDLLRPNWPMGPDTLLTLPLLQDAHRRWERLADATGQRPTHAPLNFDRSALALDAAANGHGVAIAPTIMTDADVTAGRLVEIWFPPDPSGEHLFLSWSKDQDSARHLRRIANWLLSEFGQDHEPRGAAGAKL